MKIKLFAFIVVLLMIFQIHADTGYRVIPDNSSLEILTPSLKNVKHLKIELDNGLQAYLISDPDADKSGAALAVQVGSWEDPRNDIGMAHFLEHLLFLGTKKYPEEGAYRQFISDNGGSSNAYTGSMITNYMFSVNNEAFEEALDRFAQFFIDPLFNPSGVNREMHAVNQELAMRTENDALRNYLVAKAMANPNHPYHEWGCGSLETLKSISREHLIEWYREHYSANLMHLAVISTLPMDQLIQQVIKDFSPIKNYHYSVPEFPGTIFTEQAQGKMVYIESVKDIRSLSMVWEMPREFVNDMDLHTADIVGFLLSNRGPQSLYELLHKEGLIEDIGAEADVESKDKGVFLISVDLTEKGFQNKDLVIEKIFQAINTFKNQELPRYIFNEIQTMAKINYEYQSRIDTFNAVSEIAAQMLYEDLSTYPLKTISPTKYDPNKVRKFFQFLKPDSCLYLLATPQAFSDHSSVHQEKWSGAPYVVTSINSEILINWEHVSELSSVSVPKPNPYIPENLKLVYPTDINKDKVVPERLNINLQKSLVYFAPDLKFHVPKVYLQFYLNCPEFLTSLQNQVLMDLYLKSASEFLAPQVSVAGFAGMKTSLSISPYLGMGVGIYGYSSKAEKYLHTILEELRAMTLSKELFENYKDELLKAYKNASKNYPYRQAMDLVGAIINKYQFLPEDKAEAIQGIDYEMFLGFIEKLYDQIFVRGLLYGNLTKQNAEKIFDQVQVSFTNAQAYPLPNQPQKAVIDLEKQSVPHSISKDISLQGNATILVIGEGDFSFQYRALQTLLQNLVDTPFFETLRTKQQTGYLVATIDREFERQLFSLFVIQSNSYKPEDLLVRMEVFRQDFLEDLLTNPEKKDQFEIIKKNEIKNLELQPKNLSEMGARLNLLAFEYKGEFDWFEKRIEGMKSVCFQDLMVFAKKYYSPVNPMRFAILLEGTKNPPNPYTYYPIDSVKDYKASSSYETVSDLKLAM